MTIAAQTWAIYAQQSGGVQTLWVYREGKPVQAYPLPLPTIAGDDNAPGGSAQYFTADMGDGRLGIYWYSTLGSDLHLNCLPVQPNGLALDQWPVITVTVPVSVSAYTGHDQIVTKSFILSTDYNAVNQTSGHYYYALYRKDLTHVRDGDLYVESGASVDVGANGIANDTVYLSTTLGGPPVGLKFDPTTGVPTTFPVAPPTGGWYTGSTASLTPEENLRSPHQMFVNSAFGNGNQFSYVQGGQYALFRGIGFHNSLDGDNWTSSRSVNLLDEDGNWCQFVIPDQGHGTDSRGGVFQTAEVVDGQVICEYDETDGTYPGPFITTHSRIVLDIPVGFTGFNAITAYSADHVWSEDTTTAPDYSPQDHAGYGGLTPEFWQRFQDDSSNLYNVKFWRSADNSVEDGGWQIDESNGTFWVTSYALQVPSQDNAHHGDKVLKFDILPPQDAGTQNVSTVAGTDLFFKPDGAGGPTYPLPTVNLVGSGAVLGDADDATGWALGYDSEVYLGPVAGFGQLAPLPDLWDDAGDITWTVKMKVTPHGDTSTVSHLEMSVFIISKDSSSPSSESDFGSTMQCESFLGTIPFSDADGAFHTYTGTFAEGTTGISHADLVAFLKAANGTAYLEIVVSDDGTTPLVNTHGLDVFVSEASVVVATKAVSAEASLSFLGLGVPFEEVTYTQDFATDPGWTYNADTLDGTIYAQDYQTGLTTPIGVSTVLRMRQLAAAATGRAPNVTSTSPLFTLTNPGRVTFWMNYDNPNVDISGGFDVLVIDSDTSASVASALFTGRGTDPSAGGGMGAAITPAGWAQYSIDGLPAGNYRLVFSDTSTFGADFVGPSSIQITRIEVHESHTAPWFPIPITRASVSFQCQIGATDGPYWAQPYVDWGVLDGSQPNSVLVTGSESVGTAFRFGGGPGWTQVDFTDANVPEGAQVWRPRLVLSDYDPADPPAVPATVYLTNDGDNYIAGALQGTGLWGEDPTDQDITDTTSTTSVATTTEQTTIGWIDALSDYPSAFSAIVLEAMIAGSASEAADGDPVEFVFGIGYDNPGGGATMPSDDYLDTFSLPSDSTLTPAFFSMTLSGYGNLGIGVDEVLRRLTQADTADGAVSGRRALRFGFFYGSATVPAGDTHTLKIASARLRLVAKGSRGMPQSTTVYVDCIYVPENGLSVAGQPYLDGDQPYGIWEGTPRQSTSVLAGDGYQPPPPFDPTVALSDGLII